MSKFKPVTVEKNSGIEPTAVRCRCKAICLWPLSYGEKQGADKGKRNYIIGNLTASQMRWSQMRRTEVTL